LYSKDMIFNYVSISISYYNLFFYPPHFFTFYFFVNTKVELKFLTFGDFWRFLFIGYYC